MIVTLLSDFGTDDAYVGIMKGVILSIAPAARLVDLTHAVPPQDVVAGALLLRSAVDYFPIGTVHLAVVDPGVGSTRKPVAVVTNRGLLVGPDNGLLYPAASAMGLREARRLEREELFLQPVSRTFHGRDVFAPAAAHLAAGTRAESLGPILAELQPLALSPPLVRDGMISGEVIHVDHFGNLITSVPATLLTQVGPAPLVVHPESRGDLPLLGSYSDVDEGAPLALVGSWGQIEIAVRNGHAARELGIGVGARIVVKRGQCGADSAETGGGG